MREDKEFTLPAGAEVSIIPVMQGEGLLKFDESELPDILPVLALRNAVLNATGVHMDEIPMTSQKLIAKFKEAGLI